MTRGRVEGTGGGAAASRGFDFQHRVAALMAVRILAESHASPPWGLPATTTLDFLRCETEQPVDDLLVGTSAGGLVFIQTKRKVQLSADATSDLASVLDQFVRQFIASRTPGSDSQVPQRPLEPARDRLVLAVGLGSSAPVRHHLPSALLRLPSLSRGQPVQAAATNAPEAAALRVVVEHVRRSWQETLGASPSNDEVRELLALVRVESLNVEGGGAAEAEAKILLRTVILQDASQADAAWATLIEACAGFASGRSGGDRPLLQRILLEAGFPLNVPPSYREDIARLRAYSRTMRGLVADLARIRLGETEVKIHRRSTSALRSAAERGSLLVVGEPGAGKSGALHDLVHMLDEEGRDLVFLAVDRLEAISLGALRSELALEREVIEVLRNWPGTEPAFLVIDSLDAARAEPTARVFRDLIRLVMAGGDRWRVVASIRKFDLRYGQELRPLFSGTPPTDFLDPEFGGVRHLNIPRLTDEELAETQRQAPALHALFTSASGELRELLRVAFNLRLMAELLEMGVDVGDLTPIRTQLQLLDRYWLHRVIRSNGQGDARETVLRRACEEMISARTLRVDRSRLAEPSLSTSLQDLLSSQVLSEWQPSPTVLPDRYVLAFSHHVLFDYAAARLVLRGTPIQLVARLSADPHLVMVIRPSLLLHFRHVWMLDGSRDQFWDLVLRIVRADGVPEIGKLIGPSVAAELADHLADLEPLCAAVEAADVGTQGPGEQALRHLTGSLLAAPPVERALVGPGGGPWCELLERVSRSLRAPVAYTVRSLLSTLCEKPEDFTSEQLAAAGKAARRLLGFAWTHTPRDRWLVVHALQCVCRTFASDPRESAGLLRRSLEPEHLGQYGFEETPWLARELKRLIPLDPGLVEDIYRSILGHQETSDAPTPMGDSRILPMISNRRQDYDHALYVLAEDYPGFLAQAPVRASRALIAALEAYVARERAPASGRPIEEAFDFQGRVARILTDFSVMWDASGIHREDPPLKMLSVFEGHLQRLVERENSAADLRELIEVLVTENRLAVLWRRLLLLGARFPETVGREIWPLTWAIPILAGFDTTTAVGEFLRVAFPRMGTSERERVEGAILSIAGAGSADEVEARQHKRNRLLGCLAHSDLVTDEARSLLADLQSANAVPPNEPPVRFGGVTTEPYTEEKYLADEGVPVGAEANRRIRDLERPLKEFADKHLNSVPTAEEVQAYIPRLEALRAALGRAEAEGVHAKQRDYAWGTLAAACGRVARGEGLSCADSAGARVLAVLLETSQHPDPPHHPESDAKFDEFPSWGSPAPRIEAAEGLMSLARHPTCATLEVLQAIARLSADPVPAVRFQVASRLVALYKTAPDLMWKIVERLCREELSRGVLQALLNGALSRLAGPHIEQVVDLTKAIFDRVREGPGAKQVRESCISIFTGLYVWRDHSVCREIVLAIAADPGAAPEDAHQVLHHLRDPLTHGSTDRPDSGQDAVRRRAFDLLARLLRSARDGLRRMEQDLAEVQFVSWPEVDQNRMRSLARLVDDIGSQIYFASGAFDDRRGDQAGGERRLTGKEKERFYREAEAILDELADVGLPSLAHHLLETLETFIPFDPRGVFLRIGRVIRAGQRWGYQYESMAANLMVALVERYLAEHRTLLREDERCRETLLEVLDIFVEAGWPSARRLTYRLEEIFR